MRQKALFGTTKTALAMALHLVGEKHVDTWNEYTAEILAKHNFKTARDAHAAGVPGIVTYYFEPTARLARLCEVWGKTQEALKESGKIETGGTAEDDMAVLAAAQFIRKEWNAGWKKVTPKVRIYGEGEPEHVKDEDGIGGRIKFPGMIICSIDASPEVKARLGIE